MIMRKFILVLSIVLLWQPKTHGFAPSSSSIKRLRSTAVSTPLHAAEVGDAGGSTAAALPTNNNSTQEIVFGAINIDGTVDGGVAPAAASLQTHASSQSNANNLATWQRRLITREDPFSFHKLASAGYTISSATLLGAAAVQAIKGDFATIPPALEPVMHAFTVSNIVMCSASVRMAFIHRQGDIASRNAFLGTAVSSLFSGFFMVWISPFAAGDIFNNLLISRISFAVLVGLNGVFIMDTLLKQDELIEGRRDRKVEDFDEIVVGDKFRYIFPIAFGMPLIAMTGYLASIAHDRAWFLEQCQFIDRALTGTPGMQSHIFYQQLSTSLGASYGSLFVTLRDKRLISKNQEMAGIALFAFPAFVWSVYTTYYFTTSLFMEH